MFLYSAYALPQQLNRTMHKADSEGICEDFTSFIPGHKVDTLPFISLRKTDNSDILDASFLLQWRAGPSRAPCFHPL